MTNRFRSFVAAILTMAVLLPAVVFAQTNVDRTTFSVAVTETATTVTLTAASGVVAGGYLYVDGELMAVTAVSSTVATVRRGASGGYTPARAHGRTSTVWVGSASEFKTFDVAGSCTPSTTQFYPHINTKDNRIFDCAATGVWIPRETPNIAWAMKVCPNGALVCREEFNGGQLIMQDDGTVKSVTDAEENFVYGGAFPFEYREEQTKTTSSWVAINGRLDISADDTTSAEGVEIVVGASSDAALNQMVEVGTNGACVAAMVTVTLIAGVDEFVIGFRQNEAFADAVGYEGYGDWAVLVINDAAGDLDAEDEEAGAGTQNDDTGITWANGERRGLKVCISAAGVPTFYYTAASPDNDAPIWRQATTANTGDALTSGDGLVPFIGFLAAGTTDAGILIDWIELSYAP